VLLPLVDLVEVVAPRTLVACRALLVYQAKVMQADLDIQTALMFTVVVAAAALVQVVAVGHLVQTALVEPVYLTTSQEQRLITQAVAAVEVLTRVKAVLVVA
jgi:hypothetical protein